MTPKTEAECKATADIETVPIDSVFPDPANVRRHPTKNIDAVKSSLARFGQQTPIVVDPSGVIRKGNGTHAAALELGWTTINVVRSSLAGSEATAYAIADNRSSDLGNFDDDALAQMLESLEAEGVPLEAVGYTDEDFDALAGTLDGPIPEGADGKEYDESVADEVEYCECPSCGHRFPK